MHKKFTWEYYKSLSEKERELLKEEMKQSPPDDPLDKMLEISEKLVNNPKIANDKVLFKSLMDEFKLNEKKYHYSKIKDNFKVLNKRFNLLEKLPQYNSINLIYTELEVIAYFEDLEIGSALIDLLEKRLKDNNPEYFIDNDNNLSINDVYIKAITSLNRMYAVQIKYGIITDKRKINDVVNFLIDAKEEYFLKMISE